MTTFAPTHTAADLIPEARGPFAELLAEMRRRGLEPRITWLGAGRTCADQAGLRPGVTNARGCNSWHVLGRALDIQITPPTCAAYRAIGAWWEARGGYWGGRWSDLGPCGDASHFHWPEIRGQGAPPDCPTEPAACEDYRDEYLTKAAAWSPPSGATPPGRAPPGRAPPGRAPPLALLGVALLGVALLRRQS